MLSYLDSPVVRGSHLLSRRLVLTGKPYAYLAEWLNSRGVQPGRYASRGRWTAKLVADFLRSPILHGERTFRSIIYQPILKTGKHRRELNQNPERESYPELAHFTVQEHAELLETMDARVAAHCRPRGKNHPRFRVPRSKAIWPAQHLACGICGGLMYCYERGQLKCSNSFRRGTNQCWNHIQVDGDRVRCRVIDCLCELLQPLTWAYESFLDACWLTLQRSSTTGGKTLGEVERDILGLKQQSQRLAKAIGDAGEMAALVARLKEVEASIEAAEARRDDLCTQVAGQAIPIARGDFIRNPRPTLLDQSRTSFEFAELLKRFITSATVIPVQDLLHGQVRPRVSVQVEIAGEGQSNVLDGSMVRTLTFDAFDWPQYIRLVEPLRQLRRRRPTATHAEIAGILAVKRDVLKRTSAYIKLMEQHGVDDPLLVLTNKLAQASRWRHSGD